MRTLRWLITLLFFACASDFAAIAQVTGQVTVVAPTGAARHGRDASVVLWLSPLAGEATALGSGIEGRGLHHRLIQKNKVFDPHILAVQVGSEVDFPNRDPFFHNVFSLFNGKRFDLGLYEAGSSRGVRFDRAGICYVFCNIHPQMSAVVVVVDTPYFALSDSGGNFTIPDVQPGRYVLNVWEELCSADTLKALSRQVTVVGGPTAVPGIHLRESDEPVTTHLNKYGTRYDPLVFPSPLYVQP